MSAGSDLRAIDGRCDGCGRWLAESRLLGPKFGECINLRCDNFMRGQRLRRPVSVSGIVREVNEAAAKILDAGA